MDDFLLELDEDVEGMQSTIYFLQQQLKETKDRLKQCTTEKEQLQVTCNTQQQALKDLREYSSPTNSNHTINTHRTSNGSNNKAKYSACSDDEGRHSSGTTSPTGIPTNGSNIPGNKSQIEEPMDCADSDVHTGNHRTSTISNSVSATTCVTRTSNNGADLETRTSKLGSVLAPDDALRANDYMLVDTNRQNGEAGSIDVTSMSNPESE